MPSNSPEQQRLMGQAYAVRTKKLDPKDIDVKYRDQIVKLASSMKLKDLKDFASTKHDEIKESFEDFISEESMATVSSVNGMGDVALPGNPGIQNDFVTQKKGSGDIPYSLVKGKPKKKKKSSFMNYKDFLKGSDDLRTSV